MSGGILHQQILEAISYLAVEGMPRTRFTALDVVLDPHVKPESDDDQEQWSERLLAAVKQFATGRALREAIPCQDPAKLKKVRITAASVELGDRYGRVHVHFNLTIEHETLVYLKSPHDDREINRTIAAWFSRELERDGCFCSVQLSNSSRARNYAVKSGAASATVEVRGLSAREGATGARDIARAADGDLLGDKTAVLPVDAR